MILTEIRPGDGAAPIPLHPRVTVVTGLDAGARAALLADLGRALRGAAEPGATVVEVMIDGRRQPLTRDVARRLGLHHAAAPVTLVPSDLPGSRPVAVPEPEPDPRLEAHDAARAAVASAEAARALAAGTVAEREPEVDEAEAALSRGREAMTATEAEIAALLGRAELGGEAAGVADPAEEVAAAEAALERARARAEVTGRRLSEARRLKRAAEEQESAAQAELRARIADLNRQQAELVEQRAEVVARLSATPAPGDPAPVEQALAALRRLRAVKPRASPEAQALKERWAAVRARLADLGDQAEPPEWLATPALDGLRTAREALDRAEAESRRPPPNSDLVSAAVTAHAEVLAAEQKAMRRGTRLNRRKVEQAREAESQALAALGVPDYGEFLRRFGSSSPAGQAEAPADDAVAAARAALADAEAVWEELHEGRLPAEWTAAKEDEAAIRAAALELLGREVADEALEAALDEHREAVVEPGWAEHELAEALAGAGAGARRPADVDVAEAADRWLAQLPEQRQVRAELEGRLDDIDSRLRAVGDQLAGYQGDALFAADVVAAAEGGGAPGTAAGDELLGALEEAHREAEAAEGRAGDALATARHRLDDHRRLQERLAG
ncbi:MAG TPA: hypothetical protein VFO65_01485, partial [Acidimicrobiales bacterium]|nr:hypothetical protein [Acidimicrobiales bacterium]